MQYDKSIEQLHAAMVEKSGGDIERIDKFAQNMSSLTDKFESEEKKEQWRAKAFDFNLYHNKYKEAKEEENTHLMESALRQQALDENPDEELKTLESKYQQEREILNQMKNEYGVAVKSGDEEQAKKLAQTISDQRKTLAPLHRDIRFREIHLRKQIHEKGGFGLAGDIAQAAAAGIVNTVIGAADLATMGTFPILEETMKELAAPDLEVDEQGKVIPMSYDKEKTLDGASVLGALALPAGEVKLGASLFKAGKDVSKIRAVGERIARAAADGSVNYGSALAMSVGDDNAKANAGFAGAIAGSLGFGGKVGFVLLGGSVGAGVSENVSDGAGMAGAVAGTVAAGLAIATKGAFGKINPGVTTLLKDAKTTFNMSDEVFAKTQLDAMKLFNIDDVSKLSDEQMLVSIFNSNPNAKAMMHKAIVSSEATKATINEASTKISKSLSHLVEHGDLDNAVQVFKEAEESHIMLKHELNDLLDSSGTSVKLDIADDLMDFESMWALNAEETTLLQNIRANPEVQGSEAMLLRDLISNHMNVKSTNIIERKLAMKAENVLGSIDNQVVKHFGEEEQALYFLNNRTQAQIRTLKMKGDGLAKFLNERAPLNARYNALKNVMSSEYQYGNLLRIFDGDSGMMQAFEDVVLKKMFEKASTENVINFVKLSGEINKLPWDDSKLLADTYTRGTGEIIESRGEAIRDIVSLYEKNYHNTKFQSGLADGNEHVGIRSSAGAMASATAMTKIYNNLAKLWSAESRLVSELPGYLKRQQIPANVSIEDNVVVFNLHREINDIQPSARTFLRGGSLAESRNHDVLNTDTKTFDEANFVLPSSKANRMDLARRTGSNIELGDVQSVSISNEVPEAPSSGWQLRKSTDKAGNKFTEAMFIIKDKDVSMKMPYSELAKVESVPLGDIMDTVVYKAYPRMKRLNVHLHSDKASQINPGTGDIYINLADIQDDSYVYERLLNIKNDGYSAYTLEQIKKAYNLPKTIEGRFKLILNHELQHYVTRRAFPRVRGNDTNMHDASADERLSEIPRLMDGQEVGNVKIQTALNSQDATRGLNGIEF